MQFSIDVLIPALLGLMGGIVGSLIAPWVQWNIEKRRNTLNYKRELIKGWRTDIQYNYDDNFGNTATYSAIRPHLSSDAIAKIEAPRTVYAEGGRGGNVRKQMLLDEIARIEKKWKLL